MVPKIVMKYYEKNIKKTGAPIRETKDLLYNPRFWGYCQMLWMNWQELVPGMAIVLGIATWRPIFVGEAEWGDDPSIPRHAMFLWLIPCSFMA